MTYWQQAIDSSLERSLLGDVSIDEAWALVERFSTVVRVSGTAGERVAADYILDRLCHWHVPHRLFEPELYLSVPLTAHVEVTAPAKLTIPAKTPAYSLSTGEMGTSGEVVYVPRQVSSDMTDLYTPTLGTGGREIHGRIVLTEGLSGPDEVTFFSRQGSIGQIFVNPGARIHWGICTPIWGTPDLDSIENKPTATVVDVNCEDGQRLIQAAEQGMLHVTLRTELREGWSRCPLIVAEVPGTLEPEKFVLVHGHLDSWDVGVGDNATGDATLLELARVLWSRRQDLKRSVRLAWWPGHSTGRYAGSTWYADQFGLDLAENCIAHLNADSPGCRWADTYSHVCWTPELEQFGQRVIKEVTGQEAHGSRPYRAGDYSFSNLGISGLFMLLSEMSDEKRQEMGYYAVGGCGGNIGWHTEDDTLQVADARNLERDIRVYAAAIARLVNSPIYPLDFRKLAQVLETTLRAYQKAGEGHFDLSPSLAEVAALKDALERLYARLEGLAGCSPADARLQQANELLLQMARILVAVDSARLGSFRQDPALTIEALPDLAFIKQVGVWAPDSDAYRFLQTQLVRGQNRVIWALRRARWLAERA